MASLFMNSKLRAKVVAYIQANPLKIFEILEGVNMLNDPSLYFTCQLDRLENEKKFPFRKVKALFETGKLEVDGDDVVSTYVKNKQRLAKWHKN